MFSKNFKEILKRAKKQVINRKCKISDKYVKLIPYVKKCASHKYL